INANRTEPSLSLGWLVSISTSYSRNDNTRAQGRTSHASQTAYASHGTTGCAGPRRPMSRLPESPAAWHDLCTSRRAERGGVVGDGSRGDGDRVRTGRATPMRGTKPRGARRQRYGQHHTVAYGMVVGGSSGLARGYGCGRVSPGRTLGAHDGGGHAGLCAGR